MRTIVRMSNLSISALKAAACLALATMVSGCCCTSGMIMNNSGMGYYQKGNYSMARGEFQRAVIDDPRNPDYRHNLAMAMQKQGDIPHAEQVLRHNLTVDPMHQPTYHALTQILISQQRTAEADQLLAEWRDTQPYVPEAYIEQAWFQHETGNKLAAEQNLRQALQLKPNHPVALAQMGQLYHETGQADQASAYYQRSLLARWNQPEVHSRLATVTGTTSTSLAMRRSAMVHNGPAAATMVTMNQPMNAGQPVMMGTMPSGEALAMDDPTGRPRRRHHHHRHTHGSNEQLTAYPLPNYGMADAGLSSGMITAQTIDSMPTMIGSSPTPLSAGSLAAQPTLAAPAVAGSPTLFPQADPAHATEMTAGLPVVDPH